MSATPPIGVVLVNLGTPDDPSPRAVRRYLREFLWDPCVVDANRLWWWLILHLIVLPRRPRRSARLYRRIWTEDGSPLLAQSRRQQAALQEALGPEYRVHLGMRIGRPGLAAALAACRRAGCTRVVLLPLYPQYSRTTTGSVERFVRELRHREEVPFELLVAGSFHDHPRYVRGTAERIREVAADSGPGHLVLSFHGVPVRHSAEGDPYAGQCRESAELIATELGLGPEQWTLVFQSRFGRERWEQPTAAVEVPRLAARHPRLVIACPGFAADCLETLDEIGNELAAAFRRAGGEDFRLVPCPNDDPRWIALLADLTHRTLGTGT